MDITAALKWGKENYPHLVGNEDAIVKLYKSRMLGEKIVEKTAFIYPYKSIASLELDVPAMIMVTKINLLKSKPVDVCKVCGRKVCAEHSGRVTKYANSYLMADSSGVVEVFTFEDNSIINVLESEENFIIMGILTANKFSGKSFVLKSIVPLSKAEVDTFISVMDYFTVNAAGNTLDEEKYNTFVSTLPRKDLCPKLERYYIVSRDNGRITINM
jgi:hypothetical protein